MEQAQNLSRGRGVRTFVRRKSRISRRQKQGHSRLMQVCGLPFARQPLDIDRAFGRQGPVVLEIGFGMGQATAELAVRFPERNFLAIEVHTAGIGNLVCMVEERSLHNVRILEHDALEVLEEMIPDASLAALLIFFPDPWPKKRHHKRRLVNRRTVQLFCRRLAPGGYLHVATDWAEYAAQMAGVLARTAELRAAPPAWIAAHAWRPQTKFEARALQEGRKAIDLVYLRK